MLAQEAPPGVDEIAGRPFDAPPGLEEFPIAACGNKAELHALRLVFPDRQSRLVREAPHLLFGHLPQGEEEVWQQAERQMAEKIRLILAAVHSPEQPRGIVVVQVAPGVVAGGQVSEPAFFEVVPQVAELDGGVAADAGVGGAAPDILRDKIIQHLPGEFGLQVEHREGNSQVLGQGFHPVWRRRQGRQAQVDSLEVEALALQEGGGHGAVHPAAQGDGDVTAGRHESKCLTCRKMSIFRALPLII